MPTYALPWKPITIQYLAKRRQLELKIRNMNWLINKKSQLSLGNKITIYRAIIKPVWTYGIELWDAANLLTQKFFKGFNPKR
jgi:hypothetical protein